MNACVVTRECNWRSWLNPSMPPMLTGPSPKIFWRSHSNVRITRVLNNREGSPSMSQPSRVCNRHGANTLGVIATCGHNDSGALTGSAYLVQAAQQRPYTTSRKSTAALWAALYCRPAILCLPFRSHAASAVLEPRRSCGRAGGMRGKQTSCRMAKARVHALQQETVHGGPDLHLQPNPEHWPHTPREPWSATLYRARQ